MREVLLPIGLTTGIGSLPHDDPHEAAEFALDRQPRLPAAPSLPRRSPVEGMIPQAAWGIAGVLVLPDGSLLVDESVIDPDLPLTESALDAEPFVGLRVFLDAAAGRVAPFKVQLTGPVTLGLALHAVGASPERAFAVAAQAVEARTREVVAAARRAAPGATTVVFLDEPGLTAALEPGFPWPVDDTLDLVSSALARSRGTPSPACTAAVVPTGRPSSRPARRSCRCRSTPAPAITRGVRGIPGTRRMDRLGRSAHGPPPWRGRRHALASAHERVGRAHRRRL